MTIKAVLFDMGGVIIRTEDTRPRQELAKRLGMSYAELEELVFKGPNGSGKLATLGRITTDQHWKNLGEALNLSPEGLAELQRDFWGGDRLDYQLVDAIRNLRRNYKTALLSNAWDDLRKAVEEIWKIADAFDELIISAEVGLAKPDPRIYQVALNRLDVAASEAVFIDDFSENVQGARAAGLHAILFQNPSQALDELRNLLSDHQTH